jgi:hypothetical protein
MNSFIFSIQNGLADQVYHFQTILDVYEIHGDKYKYYYYTGCTHGADITEQYEGLFKLVPLTKINPPEELIQTYRDSFSCFWDLKKYYANITYFDVITPPFLYVYIQRKISKQLINNLNLSVPLPLLVSQKLSQIKQTQNSVCVHIRMGDMLKPSVDCLISLSYIRSSLFKIIEKLNSNNITFFIFSNSMELVKNKLKTIEKDIKGNFDYVNLNQDEQGYFELELMRNCQNFIITQGGFGRLASDLSKHLNKIIICPRESDKLYNQSQKEKEWGYKWDYESNDWRKIK